MGNRELLAVKLALEEWWHWLEGSQLHFVVLTDHKNLEYIRTSNRLHLRPAQWALFVTRFNFTLTYQLGSKNGKTDALSQIESKNCTTHCDETILSPMCWINTIEWEFDKELENTLP